MLEAIRTFFGKLRGERGERKTVVQEGMLYRCIKCHMIFTTKTAGDSHECRERI